MCCYFDLKPPFDFFKPPFNHIFANNLTFISIRKPLNSLFGFHYGLNPILIDA